MAKRFIRSAAMLVMAVFITAGCLAGCGGDAKTDGTTNSTQISQTSAQNTSSAETTALSPANIKWLLRIPAQNDGDAVLAELNKTFQQQINATLEIQFIDAASYSEKTKLMIAASEEFDIMFTSPGYNFYDNVTKGAYVPLDDYITKCAPKAYAQIPENFWEAVKVNGKIYGFPNYQIAARQTCLSLRKDMAEKYGIDMKNITNYEQFEPVLAKMKEGEGKDKFMIYPPDITGIDTMNYLGLETLGATGTPGAVEINGTDYKVINQYENEKFISLAKTFRSWQEKGYINKDLSLAKSYDELFVNGKILSMVDTYKPGYEAETFARFKFEPKTTFLTEPYVSTSSVAATMQAVSKTSKNPERALMLLEIVNTDKKVYNTLLYGLEDKHYKKTGENSIELIKDSGYSTNVAWMLGNQLNAYLLPGVDSNIPQLTDEMNRNSKVSRIMGFAFNAEPVKVEIAQCLTIIDKYVVKGFRYGIYDVDSTLATMNSELKAAGMDKVIAEKQKQLEEWAAVNKK